MGLFRRHSPPEDGTHEPSPSLSPEVVTFTQHLHIGQYIDLVFHNDRGQHADYHRTTLLARLAAGDLVVSQPTYPLNSFPLHQPLEATIIHIDPKTNRPMRLGFHTAICAFAEQYRVPNNAPPALILAPPRELHRVNIRSAFRVPFPADLYPPIHILDARQKPYDFTATLVDLSATGALFHYHWHHDTPVLFQHEDRIYLELDLYYLLANLGITLTAAQAQFAHSAIPCRIVREYAMQQGQGRYVAVEFLKLLAPQAELLHILILKIQQQIAAGQEL